MKQLLSVLFLLHVPFLLSAIALDSSIEIAFVGDVNLSEEPGQAIREGIDPFVPFSKLLDDADLRVGNLECVISTKGAPEDKPFTFRADPIVVPILHSHLDAVTIANNHSGDFGKEAFLEELSFLRAAGIPYFGGGKNLSEAHHPLIIKRKGYRIALLGYGEFKPRSFEATAVTPGVAWSGDDEQVLYDIRLAREKYGADLVIPYMHWGWEEEPIPCQRQREFARRMINEGADLVLGSHPHITQGAEYYKNHLIVYSLGNFIFGDSEVEKIGWLLKTHFTDHHLEQWSTFPALLDSRGIPSPLLHEKSLCGNAQTEEMVQCEGANS